MKKTPANYIMPCLLVTAVLAAACVTAGPVSRLAADGPLSGECDSILLVRLRIVKQYADERSPGLFAPSVTFLSAQKASVHDVFFPNESGDGAPRWKKANGAYVFDELLAVEIESGKYKFTGIDLGSRAVGGAGYRSPYAFVVPPKSLTYFGQWIFEIDEKGKFRTGVETDAGRMAADVELFSRRYPKAFALVGGNRAAARPVYDPKILGFSDE